MLQKLRKVLRNKKGQGLVEYAILVGGVALVCLAAVALLGHKTNDIVALVTTSLPGAHPDDAGPILSGKLVATDTLASGGIGLDLTATNSMANNFGFTQASLEAVIVEPTTPAGP